MTDLVPQIGIGLAFLTPAIKAFRRMQTYRRAINLSGSGVLVLMGISYHYQSFFSSA